MKNLIVYLVLFIFMGVSLAGPIDIMEFSDSEQEKRYYHLIEELRCLKCQNSNLAGSNAELAQDLRHKVYDMIVNKNMSNKEIKEWMLARYGDFVLYRPQIAAKTYLLWGLPVILVMLGAAIVISRLRRSQTAEQPQISDEQQKILDELVK